MPKLVFVSVVPSPYQRDLFATLAARGRVPLQVYYLEQSADDSPWPVDPPAAWERILPGRTFGRGTWRSHLNWSLPAPVPRECWIVNGSMTDITTQLLMRRLGGRTAWHFWGEAPSVPGSAWRRWVQRRQYAPLRRARTVVAIGQRAARAYAELLPGTRVLNQAYTCRLEAFAAAAKTRTPHREPVFLFCGQMIARKGIDVLLRAFDQIVAQGVAARLELVGREAELPTLLAALPPRTRERVNYRGFLAPAELPAHFAAADVFVLPSRHDGWGVVVNQALGAGLPVICSDAVGAGHDLVQPDLNGLIVPAGDAIALAAAMRRLALEPELRRAFGAASQAAAERLAPDRAAEFWESLAGSFP